MPQDAESFALEIGEALILPARIATQVVNDPGGEPLACAARALDMPSAAFQRVLMFLNPEFGSSVQQRLPAVAALRPAHRTIRAGDAGGVARLDHGGDPRQIPSRAVRRRAQPRPRRRTADASRGAARQRAGVVPSPIRKLIGHASARARIRLRDRGAVIGRAFARPVAPLRMRLGLRQIQKMPPGPVLGLDDPDVGIETDFLGETFFDRLLGHRLRRSRAQTAARSAGSRHRRSAARARTAWHCRRASPP